MDRHHVTGKQDAHCRGGGACEGVLVEPVYCLLLAQRGRRACIGEPFSFVLEMCDDRGVTSIGLVSRNLSPLPLPRRVSQCSLCIFTSSLKGAGS